MISQQIYLKKMSYVPEFVALYEIIPFIEYLPLNNATIRDAVEIYYNFSCLEYIRAASLASVAVHAAPSKPTSAQQWLTPPVA